MEGYYCNSSHISSSSSGPRLNLNLLNDSVSPFHSPLGPRVEASILMRYLRSGLPLDHDYSSLPNQSRPMVNYYHHHKSSGNSGSSSSSGGFRSPLSAVENFDRSTALVKVDDDVMVVDGIFVASAVPKRSGNFRSTITSDSGGISSSSSSNSGNNIYKKELCLSWEDTGACRYGHKCEFGHGKEELGPNPTYTRARHRNKLEMDTSISDLSPGSSKFAATTPPAKAAPPESTPKVHKASHIELKGAPTVGPKITSTDWSPFDDCISIILPSLTEKPVSREDFDEYIRNLLYGTTQRKRLPVFSDICAE